MTTSTESQSPTTLLQALRKNLAQHALDGFLVPMADEFQSEYVPASAQRLAAITGFTGSAGFAVVLQDCAAFFTDGRYTLQAAQQIPATLYQCFDSAEQTPSAWLGTKLKAGMKIGFDPWLHTAQGVDRLRKVIEKAGAILLPLEPNPIDTLWRDRPAVPLAPIVPHDIAYAGIPATEKITTLAKNLQEKNLAAVVITDPASIAWLLNIRGGDVPHTPLPLSFAILYAGARVDWFVDPRKLTPPLADHLGVSVTIRTMTEFPLALDALNQSGKPVRIDPAEAALWIVERLRRAGVTLDEGEDPSVLPRACKNPTEVEGMRAAHRRDGAALVRFLAWLEQNYAQGNVTEISAADVLENFRAASNLFRGVSFDTIAGAGDHGAIVHYKASAASNRTLASGMMFLLDSGGQYLDGTTDVTRTLALGTPSAEMRDRFTRVLKGHIALSAIRFPEGTTGSELDALARQYLWAAGLDYSHGTGHGVGCYLGVHEGPQGISRRSPVALRPGMVVSNEPGYYKAGAYGIRIENLQIVTPPATPECGERAMLGFEPLTLVPIDRHLIVPEMLSRDERAWLNAYHQRVHDTLHDLVEGDARAWLKLATAAL